MVSCWYSLCLSVCSFKNIVLDYNDQRVAAKKINRDKKVSVKRYFELEPDLSPIFYSTLNSNSVQFFYVVPKIKVTLKEHFNAFSTK